MIIGITGYKGHGKDTAAKVFIRRNYRQDMFAYSLKEACKLIFNLTDKEINDRVLKEKKLDRWPYLSPREILQYVGTDMFRASFPKVWVNSLLGRINDNEKVVVTDVRFPDEAEALRSLGAKIIRVVRPDMVPTDLHESERHIPTIPVDVEIINDGTVKALHKAVEFYSTQWVA